MPQGVEHRYTMPSITTADGVKGPMMPQGVEHATTAHVAQTSVGVKGPMMPQGVEHPTWPEAGLERRHA